MSNILKKAANIKIVSVIIAVILAAAVAVGVVFGIQGWGVFNKDALMKDANTITVSVAKFVYINDLEKVESECESVLGEYGISYEMKGVMSGDACEIVYVFDKGADLKEAATKLTERLDSLMVAGGEFESASFSVAVNSEAAVGTLARGYIVRGIIAGVVLVALVFAYIAIRYGLFMGITGGVATLLGSLLTVALIIVTRAPVTASVIYVIAVGALLSAIASVIALNKIRENDGEEVAVAADELGTLFALMAAAVVVIGAVATAGVRWFAVLALLALVAAAFIGIVFVPAMYVPFKVAIDNKPVEGAYVGAVKTSTKEKKVFVKKEEPAKAAPVVAPVEEAPVEEEEELVEETEEAPVEEAIEEVVEESVAEEAPVEEPVEEEAVAEETELEEAPVEEATAEERAEEEKQD